MSAGMSKPKKEAWKGAKTRNLTAKQQAKAKRVVGGGRMEKITKSERTAASKAGPGIGETKWMTAKERKEAGQKGRGGLLVGADGKPVTGTITLASGKKAQYVRGKRIGVAAGKPKGQSGSGGTSRPRTTTTRVTPSARGEGAGSVRPTATAGRANLTPSAVKNLGRARGQAARGSAQAGRQASTISATGRPMSTPSYTTKKNGNQSKPTNTGSGRSGVGSQFSGASRPSATNKPVYYANGSASVWDSKLGRRVTVMPSDPRHPKYKK